MFIATPDGVIATNPISTAAGTAYLTDIRTIASAPVRSAGYGHHHFYYNIAGGVPFKQVGDLSEARRLAKKRLRRPKDPDVLVPDLKVDSAGDVLAGLISSWGSPGVFTERIAPTKVR